MKYLFLLNRTRDAMPEPGTPEAAELLAAYTEVTAAMAEAKVLVDCAPLQPSSATTTPAPRRWRSGPRRARRPTRSAG